MSGLQMLKQSMATLSPFQQDTGSGSSSQQSSITPYVAPMTGFLSEIEAAEKLNGKEASFRMLGLVNKGVPIYSYTIYDRDEGKIKCIFLEPSYLLDFSEKTTETIIAEFISSHTSRVGTIHQSQVNSYIKQVLRTVLSIVVANVFPSIPMVGIHPNHPSPIPSEVFKQVIERIEARHKKGIYDWVFDLFEAGLLDLDVIALVREELQIASTLDQTQLLCFLKSK